MLSVCSMGFVTFLLILFAVHLAKTTVLIEVPSEEVVILENEVDSRAEVLKNCSIITRTPPRYHWKKVSWPSIRMPTDAVQGGADSPYGCGMVFVGRALYDGQLLPCKICGSDGRAFVEYNDTEVMLNDSEVLCSHDVLWKPVREGELPSNSFEVASTDNGEKLYIGRGFVGTLSTPGKVMGRSKRLFMTYNQKVYSTLHYEVLLLG